MGRPKKDARERLDAKINIRLPTHVRDAWRKSAEAAGMNLTDWIRSQVRLDGMEPVVTHKPTPRRKIPRRSYTRTDPELLRHIAKIGNNVNQIAKEVNRRENSIYGLRVLERLVSIERAIQALKEQSCTSNS